MKVPVYERRLGIQPMNIPNAPTLQPISDNGEGTGKAMQDMFTRLQKINDDMEDARTLELFTKFKQDSQDYHEHPDKGLYRTRLGFEARGVYSDADQWMRQKGEEYVRQLPSERAKGAFRKMAKEYIIQRGEQNSKFEADQKRQYIDQSTEATIKNAIMLAGKYWDKPEHIQQARAEIYPALELRLRGAGREAFKNALAEVEDRIGTIRVAQALARHPLQALEMLRNPDVHLKPDTRAKLQLTMEQHAEVYELQAIADEYAKHYTPETAVEAREKLIEYYGAEKGQKAFAALQRIWAVAQGQEAAIKKNERERQEKNEDQLRIQIGDPNRPNPTDEQLTRSVEAGNISAQFYLQAMRTNESDREKAERERKRKAKNELWARVSNNDFPTLEELQRGVEAGEIDPSDADYATRRREEHERETYEQNESAILDKIFFGTASVAEIEQARKDGKIRAQFASTAKNHLTTILTKSESERREDYENMLITMAREGTFKNPERVNELLRQKRISRGVAGTLWSIMDAAPAREAQELSRQQSKNADEVILKMINGNISIEEIKKGANDGTLDPNFARGAINYLEGLQEKDERKKQEKIESAISLIIENGGRVPREQINDLQQKGFISPAFGSRVRSKYDSEDEAAARQAAQAEREHTKQERKLQAQKAAREIMEEFGDDFAGALDAVNAIPASEYANDVRSELEHLIQARKTHAQQQQQGTKDAQETAYRKYYADAYGGKMSRDDIHKLWQDKVISEAQRDNLYQLINARERNDIQQLKKLADEQGFTTAQKLMEKHNGDIAVARREIEALGPGDLYDATFKYLSQFAETAHIKKQQDSDAIKQAQEKVFNETWSEFIHGDASSEEAIRLRREKAIQLRSDLLISDNHWTRLMHIVEQQETARAKVQKELRESRLYDAARDIAREFGEDKVQAGYARIEEIYQGNNEDIRKIKEYYRQFLAEQAAHRQAQDRQRAEQQREKYLELADTYWRKYLPVPDEELRRLERERGLSTEQITRAQAMNARMRERTGLIEEMRRRGEDVDHMALPELETRLQQIRGISEDVHRDTVARLLKAATEGTLTDEEIDWEYASGRLWGDDRERLKKFDSKLDQDRKRKIRETERVILGSIMKHANPKEKVALMYMARTLFYLGTDAIDTRAPDFFKALEEVQKNVEMAVYEAITEGKPQTEGMLWWEKPSAQVRRGLFLHFPTFHSAEMLGTSGQPARLFPSLLRPYFRRCYSVNQCRNNLQCRKLLQVWILLYHKDSLHFSPMRRSSWSAEMKFRRLRYRPFQLHNLPILSLLHRIRLLNLHLRNLLHLPRLLHQQGPPSLWGSLRGELFLMAGGSLLLEVTEGGNTKASTFPQPKVRRSKWWISGLICPSRKYILIILRQDWVIMSNCGGNILTATLLKSA